jgi:ssDNA-binding replication factor A large subunit
MTVNEIVEHILSKLPKVSRSKILEKLHEEKKKRGEFFSDEVLLRKIAAELGVEVQKEIVAPELSIQDLISGLNDVSVVGRVVAVFPTRTFGKQEEGKVASLLVIDENSILRVILWNEKAEYVESRQVKTGKIIHISHGYTKEGYKGKLELHLGEKGEIKIDPDNINQTDYPSIEKLMTKISEITSKHVNERVNITGIVKEIMPISTFERKDASCGKVMRFRLADKTGEIPVVVWNQKVDEFGEIIERGIDLQVINTKVKDALGEGFEVHVDSRTYVETTEQ